MTGLLSPVHVALVVLVVLLVFGGRRLPGFGRQLGTTIRTQILGKPPAAAPAALPEPAPAPPGTLAPVPRRPSSAARVAAPSVRRRVVFVVLRRIPGPVGWVARLLAR